MSENSTDKRRFSLRFLFWIIAILLGALQAWCARHMMVPDGISYLDIGDAFLRGDWQTVLNGHWSPLYPALIALAQWLIGPAIRWEFAVVHVVNFVVYLIALCGFDFLLREVIRNTRQSPARGTEKDRLISLPEWSWTALGYTLFLGTSLRFNTVERATPDMMVAAAVFFAAGFLLRLRATPESWAVPVFLGVTLGLGCLAKAIMFPLAVVTLLLAACLMGCRRPQVGRLLVSAFVFLIVVAPFVVALSLSQGRATWGESGRLIYAAYVNGALMTEQGAPNVHWRGGPAGTGSPLHPTRKLLDSPPVYEFACPIKGTFPPWFDPAYWMAGIEARFQWKAQWTAVGRNLLAFTRSVLRSQAALLTGLLLLMAACGSWGFVRAGFKQSWPLLALGAAGIAAYMMVNLEERYIAPFVVLVWLGLLGCVRLGENLESDRLIKLTTTSVVAVELLLFGLPYVKSLAEYERFSSRFEAWQVAETLRKAGVDSGSPVGCIGHSFDATWARLARVKIVAEIPASDLGGFWFATGPEQQRVLSLFVDVGVRAIVADHVPQFASTAGWQKIEGTGRYVRVFSAGSPPQTL